jgi:hypothetical protein
MGLLVGWGNRLIFRIIWLQSQKNWFLFRTFSLALWWLGEYPAVIRSISFISVGVREICHLSHYQL